MLFEFSNNMEYLKPLHEDTFMQGFLANIYLRPSCYDCQFKTTERQADITLADFWGIQRILPELDDDKGTSFVWIHSDRGINLFQNIENQIICQKIEVSDALKSNSAALSSCPKPVKRELFFENFNTSELEQNIRKYAKKPLKKQIRQFLGRIKRKLLKG